MHQFKKEPKVQGQDSIIINAPTKTVWPLIQDSMQLEFWGPPVERVKVELLPDQSREGKGSKRKVWAKFTEKRKGWFEEVRIDEKEGKSIVFMIYNDNFGLDKMLEDVGGVMELEVMNEEKTKFTFTFYHRPKNILGWLMNPMIKADQKKNRLKALASIKSYAETGIAIKN
ncbi:MAG: SRPBCC family protein [Cycloclasticus sp.]|nr:SRPBCC family protein [Cycloclasticus sp.]